MVQICQGNSLPGESRQGESRQRDTAHYRRAAALWLLAVVLLIPPSTAMAEQPFQRWSLRPLCAMWDGQAGEAVVRRVRDRDADLRRLGDDITRMQRARRSCDLGLIQAACRDYIAVMRDVGGTADDWPGATLVCPAALAADPHAPTPARTAE